MSTSEQARADAIADAETLRRFCFAREGDTTAAVLDVIRQGQRAAEATIDGWGLAGLIAFDAARAAFRAVPGLRGE